jgi:hypothetical protein
MSRNLKQIATALRVAVLDVYGSPKDACIAAALAIRSVYADAEIWTCKVDGEPHVLAKLDGKWIDVTADQFCDAYAAEVVFGESDLADFDFRQYHRFERTDTAYRGWDRLPELVAAFRAAI